MGMERMIGKSCPTGPGGRDCVCCGDAPGSPRVKAKRSRKRGERNRIRQTIANGDY